MSESSPARTAPATTIARVAALAPGASAAAPATPRSSRHAFCGLRCVPPPTVPTSIDGIVTEIRSAAPLPSASGGTASMSVMQFDDSTFCAASWPVARKTAVTMFDACALKPPLVPAIADPTKFFAVLSCAAASGVVLSTRETTSAGSVASATTEQPRPSIQLTAAGFLSEHRLPLSPRSCMSPNSDACSASRTAVTPLDTMFIPIASPVVHAKRAYAYRPATVTRADDSRAKRDVASKAAVAVATCSGASSDFLKAAARAAGGKRSTGARVIPCCSSVAVAPPDSAIALQPRFVDAIRQPSTVAIGTWNSRPFRSSGPATPTGSGT